MRATSKKIPPVDRLKRIHHLLAEARNGLAITDGSGRLIYANKAMAEMHGFPPAAFVSNVFAALAAVDQLRFLEAACALIARPGGSDREIDCEHRNRTMFRARLRRSCLEDERGNPIGVIFVFQRSSTARRSAEPGKSRPVLPRSARGPAGRRSPSGPG